MNGVRCRRGGVVAGIAIATLVVACGGAGGTVVRTPAPSDRVVPTASSEDRDSGAGIVLGPGMGRDDQGSPGLGTVAILRFVTDPDAEPCVLGRDALQAELEARAWAGGLPVRLEVVDVSSRPDLLARFEAQLPVLLLGNGALVSATDRARIRAFLARFVDDPLG